MGGHGALTLYLASKTKQYRSASAFSPVTNPSECAWGKKAFNGYLQEGITEGRNKYDATELISKSKEPVHILIDYAGFFSCEFPCMVYLNVTYQGTSDKFYQQGQLLPENFLKAARAAGYDEFQVRVRSQVGYDHSYYFVRIPHSGRINVY
jgi:S-formylglutathione hydrolase